MEIDFFIFFIFFLCGRDGKKKKIKINKGAGQDVGRSCVLVTMGGKNIMFDCGMHMAYNDERRFPDFQFISQTGDFNKSIDAVVISHL